MATLTITYNPRRAVPEIPRERAEWLERHGAPPSSAELSVELSYRRWAELGAELVEDGSVQLVHYKEPQQRLEAALAAAAVRLVRETGQVVAEIPGELLTSTLREYQADEQRRVAEKAAAEAGQRADHEAKREQERARLSALLSGPEDALVVRADDEPWKARSHRGSQTGTEIVRLESAVRERAEAIAKQRNAREAAESRSARDAWIRDHGTDSQRARYAEGLLPEAELLDAVRGWAFAPLVGQSRYVRIEHREVRHDDECYQQHIECDVLASDDDQAEGLSEIEYEALARIRELAKGCPLPATVEAREHWCRCESCKSPYVTRQSAHVTVTFAGRGLSREYAL
jgi:hypothetical protein